MRLAWFDVRQNKGDYLGEIRGKWTMKQIAWTSPRRYFRPVSSSNVSAPTEDNWQRPLVILLAKIKYTWGMESTLFDRTFRDSEGKFVLAQMPNLPLLVWVATSLLQLLLTSGKIHTAIDLIAFGSLFTWAWQELFQGVNYFRRALGFVVLVGAIALKIQWPQLI